MPYTYDLNGERHTMSDAEALSILVTGTPHRAQDYALTGDDMTHGDHATGALAMAVRIMAERPGQVEPGDRPSAEVMRGDRSGMALAAMRPGAIHMRSAKDAGKRACDGLGAGTSTYSASMFSRMVHNARACRACLSAYNDLKRAEAKRHWDGAYVKPMRWAEDELRRLREWRKEGSAAHDTGAGKRVWPKQMR